MDITANINKMAKEIQATMFYQHQALNYLRNSGLTSGLAIEPKDIKRIKDFDIKSKGDQAKYFSLVNQMAKSIQDAQKAYRRGAAVMQYANLPQNIKERMASVFFEKAISLG